MNMNQKKKKRLKKNELLIISLALWESNTMK